MGIESMRHLLCFMLAAAWMLQSCAQSPLDTWAEEHGVLGFSVSVATESGPTSTWTGGLRDVEAQLPVNAATTFRVASISKAAVAVGFFKLWANGEIGLDDDINETLSTTLSAPVLHPQHPSTPLTPRMLLSHTSGLRDGSGYSDFLSSTYNASSGSDIPTVLDVLSPTGAQYTVDMWGTEPGTYFAYANLNFGLLATVMEAVTQTRFDVWMRNEVFAPLNMNASFAVQDLESIENLAVLYRHVGNWIPQVDNHGGIMPEAPNLTGYAPGTNAARFSPQGGLRCSAPDLLTLVNEWVALTSGGTTSQLLPPPAVQALREEAWSFDGSNGSNYGGLFEAWGLGLHVDEFESESHPTSGQQATAWGHPGEAYGLISGAYHVVTSDGCRWKFAYLVNGMNPEPSLGEGGWYSVENALHNILGQWANASCTTSQLDGQDFAPKPRRHHLRPGQTRPADLVCTPCVWTDWKGRMAHQTTQDPWLAPSLPAGHYVLTEHGMVVGSVLLTP